MTNIDAKGIRVSLILPREIRGDAGHPSWVIPFGGAECKDERTNIKIEVCPDVDMSTEQWRDYDELEKIAANIEKNGGFMWHNDEIHTIDNDIIVGRDALHLLTQLWHRAADREGDKGAAEASYRQGWNDAQREFSRKLGDLKSSLAMKYKD